MESLRYRTYRLMAKGEWTSPKLAKALGIPEPQARNCLKNMKWHQMIERISMNGHHGVYRRIEGINLHPQGTGSHPRSLEALKPNGGVRRMARDREHRGDKPTTRGYGAGTCALEEAWPMAHRETEPVISTAMAEHAVAAPPPMD